MRHSLLGRFRGAFLGTALGELLGANCQARAAKVSESWLEVRGWGFQPPPLVAHGWGRLVTALTLELIYQEAKPVDQAIPPSSAEAWRELRLAPAEREPWAARTGMAIATLPLLLFCHEATDKLRHYLEQLRVGWHLPPGALAEALVVGDVLSSALRNRLHPDRLIPHLLETLDSSELSSDLAAQLATVQRLIGENAGLATAQRQLSASAPLALALYSFLSSPEEMRLSLLRAARMQKQPQLVCALTGALSGAYNGVAGIPLDWRNALHVSSCSSDQAPLSRLWNIASDDELLLLADQLLALWSGVYQLGTDRRFSPRHYTAAPRSIRGEA